MWTSLSTCAPRSRGQSRIARPLKFVSPAIMIDVTTAALLRDPPETDLLSHLQADLPPRRAEEEEEEEWGVGEESLVQS